jgi:hypothetical protein
VLVPIWNPTALLAGAGGVRAVRVPKYLTGKLATSDRVIYRSQSSSRDVIPRFANTTKAEHSRLYIFCAVGRAACRRRYETALQARVLSAAQASECYDQLISESTPKDLPELPIESSKLALVITQARVVLQLALSGIWRENSLGGGLDFGDAFYIPFYDAFGLQATQVLKACASLLDAPEVETCLRLLRERVIPSILSWLEPDPACWEEPSQALYKDLTPSGEWERWMERSYRSFRVGKPSLLSAEVDQTVFRIRVQAQLRRAEPRRAFRERIENVLNDAMVPIEAEVRGQDKIRTKWDPNAPSPKRSSAGFAANEDDHSKVARVVESFGRGWRTQLPEVCRRLHEAGALIPKACKKDECESWLDVLDLAEADAHQRERVIKYIEYRLTWIRNPRIKV